MAKYLEENVYKEINESRLRIYSEREKIYSKYQIDILDNDVMSSMPVCDIVTQYDKDYKPNFARNGEDAISNNVLIETKNSKIKKPTNKTTFMFHAMGDICHDRYIFVVRLANDLRLLRLYDISNKSNVAIIQLYLLNEKQKWLEKCKNDSKKMKYDVISIPEKFILSDIIISKQMIIDDCHVTIA